MTDKDKLRITAESILTKHTGWTRERSGEANLSDIIDAMEEYAQQFQKPLPSEIDLREELLLFAQYINKIGWSIPKNEVDEYLKSQKQ